MGLRVLAKVLFWKVLLVSLLKGRLPCLFHRIQKNLLALLYTDRNGYAPMAEPRREVLPLPLKPHSDVNVFLFSHIPGVTLISP